MIASQRLVVDTNVVLSGILFPGSVPNRAVLKAQDSAMLVSEATRLELIEVIGRKRFDRYLDPAIRQKLLSEYLEACRMIDIPTPIHACRDPRDDKFLEVAVHGRADLIVTGDADLLALHPFQGIAILSPAGYLQLV
jgi:putative PIN family toxin of toxin-antitoxin system